MKTRMCLMAMFIAVFAVASCEKEGPVGPEGPQGEQGPQGPVGAKGDKGDPGNANVLLYEFGEQTFTNLLSLHLSVSRQVVDESLILVYYNPAAEAETAWYPIPGLGSSNKYQTRYLVYQTGDPDIYRLDIRLLQPDGSGAYGSSVTFRKIKVIFAEASSILTGKMEKQIDLQDYNTVKRYYNIQD